MRILGIETSCDETAAAVVEDGRRVLSNIIHSQVAKHRPYGGVVPEIASRDHLARLPDIVEQALGEADVSWKEIDAVAVTFGPGLAGSLLVGYAYARALALRLNRPLVGVNHHEGHLHAVFLGDDAPAEETAFPMLALLVSGGDSSLVLMDGPGRYRIVGRTIDDAAGEALDKAAALLRLGYPGGPIIQRTAEGGDPAAVRFPRGLEGVGKKWPYALDRDLCFSFSGLKTALLNHLKRRGGNLPEGRELRDVCASYQEAVCDALVTRLERALERFPVRTFACAGGVSLNRRLREKLSALSKQKGIPLLLAAPAYCADNAAMIAGAAAERLRRNEAAAPEDIRPGLRLA